MTERFRGIYCPNIVPLDDAGDIDEAGLRGYVDWLIARGVHGLYPNGSTGEFTRFTPTERRRIVEIVIDQAAGRVPVLAGAAEANVRETLAACEHYAKLGARAVAIVSPFYYEVGPEGIYAYFAEIARHTPIDVTLYNIPLFASPIDLATVRRLADECPHIVGIKDSSGDVGFMREMLAAIRPQRPDWSFLTGWDAQLVPMLEAGADGGTNATSGIAPEWTRALFDTMGAGDRDAAAALQQRITRIFDAMFGAADFPGGFRMGLGLRGVRTGPGRMPLSPALRDQHARSRAELRALFEAEGLVEGSA